MVLRSTPRSTRTAVTSVARNRAGERVHRSTKNSACAVAAIATEAAVVVAAIATGRGAVGKGSVGHRQATIAKNGAALPDTPRAATGKVARVRRTIAATNRI